MPDGVVLLASISSVELVAPASERDLQNKALVY